MTRRLLPFITAVLSVCAACTDGKQRYSLQLVEADSAIVNARYAQADSLLADFDVSEFQHSDDDLTYRKLLFLCRKYVDDSLGEEHFLLADSLCRLYKDCGLHDKHAKALLALGDIYKAGGDNPSALDCYNRAKQLAFSHRLPAAVKGWACQCLGNLYLSQRMLDECIPYYRQFYEIAVSCHDTLRMAYAAYYMGKVCTIKSNVDSTIFYYDKSVELASFSSDTEKLRRNAVSSLCDIYIQIGEFEKAYSLLPRDELNAANWAYWHGDQNHVDSAIFYFNKAIARDDPYSAVDYLHALVQLSERNDNARSKLYWYKRLVEAQDSLRIISQTEETRKAQARYNYNQIATRLDKAVTENRLMRYAAALEALLSCMLALIVWGVYWHRKKKHKEVLLRERFIHRMGMERYERSMDKWEANQDRARQLDEEAGQQEDDSLRIAREMEKSVIASENATIEAVNRQRDFMLQQFQQSQLYHKIFNPTEQGTHLSDEEWQQLEEQTDKIFNHLFNRLSILTRMSEMEKRICCLVMFEADLPRMALMLSRSKSAVSATRRRLYEKITGKKGSAPQFDEFLRNY